MDFYKKNNIRYRVVNFRYQQEQRKRSQPAIAKFTFDLAKRIERGDKILYMDESSCNLWMRGRYTWTNREKPVKMQIN